MFTKEFWANLRPEHLLLLAGWVITGTLMYATVTATQAQHTKDIDWLRAERIRDDRETQTRVETQTRTAATLEQQVRQLTEAVRELQADIRRAYPPMPQRQ